MYIFWRFLQKFYLGTLSKVLPVDYYRKRNFCLIPARNSWKIFERNFWRTSKKTGRFQERTSGRQPEEEFLLGTSEGHPKSIPEEFPGESLGGNPVGNRGKISKTVLEKNS